IPCHSDHARRTKMFRVLVWVNGELMVFGEGFDGRDQARRFLMDSEEKGLLPRNYCFCLKRIEKTVS
ncbi:MAG: hypothetical protein PHT39_05300, partial [Sphaerochaetaceae bacterium]|nr:hypothetical protein [Sphaerochaetaceae bacterium]